MNRYRFLANIEDWRPVVWPPVGPCWCTGITNDHSVVVAYANDKGDILRQWPEATDIECTHGNVEPEFTSRFPRPSWWPGDTLGKEG